MQTELEQILESIQSLKKEFNDSEAKLETKIEAYKIDVKLFDSKFNYYQQAMQWVNVLAFSLIIAATAITIFSTVFAFRN